MIKRTTTTILLAMMATLLVAIPARKKPFTLTQVDGSTMTVRLVGDETMHYYTTLDGTPLVKDTNGMYRPATYFETQNIKAKHAQRIMKRNAARARRTAARRAKGTYTGEKRGLVILVNFKDVKMKSTSTVAAFNDLFNQEGYNKNDHIGSVRDYFLAQSYGQLTIDFDVVGPYTLSQNMKYYGEDDVDEEGEVIEGADLHPAEMIIEALKKANADVNFKDYDWDGDGEVDQVYVIYAGYNQAHGAESNTIWPHEWTLQDAQAYGDGTGTLLLDGVRLNTYACSSELIDITGSNITTIGTAVHEFSHCLGLPDFYDTDSQTNFGMNTWSVMDSGSYNGEGEWGEVPAGYTSYERMFAGWLTPVELNSPCIINDMKPISETPEAYIIYNDKNKDEYYLLENRQPEGFDSYLYGHGMLVVHVDYDKQAWEQNSVNNTASHQRCTIIPADNQFMTGSYNGQKYATSDDLAGDPYPGTSKNKSLTDTSKPAATLYNANTDGSKYMGKPIENITESNGLISFTFMGGMTIDAPTLLAETDVTSNAFTANWQTVENATMYELQLKYATTVNIASMHVLAEDFSGFASYTGDGTNDIGSNLDKYMQVQGWTGFKVYTSASRVKLGSARANGRLTSPLLDAPQTSQVTVVLSETIYSGKSAIDIDVILVGADDTELASQTVKSGKDAHIITFDGISQSYKVKFMPADRIYIDRIDIYDGAYTADQIAADGETGYDKITSFTSATTSYTFTGLDPDTEYLYRVRAVVNNFGGTWSEWKLPASSSVTTGDVNHDGTVDTQDVLAIYQWMQASDGDTAPAGTPEDVNHDGQVDTQDVLAVYKLMQDE